MSRHHVAAWEPLRWRPPHLARFGLVLLSMTGDDPDMHLAGALMWFVGDGLMMAVALVIAGRWVASKDRSDDLGAYLDAARLAYDRMLAGLAEQDYPHPRGGAGDR